MSYDDGEDAFTRLAYVDEWLTHGDERRARNCFWQRYAEIERLPAERLAEMDDDLWAQFIARVRFGWAEPFSLSGIC